MFFGYLRVLKILEFSSGSKFHYFIHSSVCILKLLNSENVCHTQGLEIWESQRTVKYIHHLQGPHTAGDKVKLAYIEYLRNNVMEYDTTIEVSKDMIGLV